MNAKRLVRIETRTVGQSFGTVGIVRDAKTGEKLAESETVRPYGYTYSAARDADEIAQDRGWQVEREAEAQG